MGNIEQQKVVNMNNVFDDHFLDINTLYEKQKRQNPLKSLDSEDII